MTPPAYRQCFKSRDQLKSLRRDIYLRHLYKAYRCYATPLASPLLNSSQIQVRGLGQRYPRPASLFEYRTPPSEPRIVCRYLGTNLSRASIYEYCILIKTSHKLCAPRCEPFGLLVVKRAT